MSLKRLLRNSTVLKFAENSFTSKNHEESVRSVIETSGFRNNHTKILSHSDYTYQPNGSQNPPDFSLNYRGKIYNIECKSSKKIKKPMWNCSIPDKDTLYIFSIPDSNILFFGDWIIDEKSRMEMESYIEESKLLAKKYNNRLLKLDNEYKWNVRFRKMFEQNTVFDKNRREELRVRMEEFISSIDESVLVYSPKAEKKIDIVFEDDE